MQSFLYLATLSGSDIASDLIHVGSIATLLFFWLPGLGYCLVFAIGFPKSVVIIGIVHAILDIIQKLLLLPERQK